MHDRQLTHVPTATRPQHPRRLRDVLRETIDRLGYSPRTGKVYWNWIRQYCQYHSSKRPRELGAGEIEQFLIHIARDRGLAGRSLNQARAALKFLYEEVYRTPIADVDLIRTAKCGSKLPVVLSRDEVVRLLQAIEPGYWLPAAMMYAGGLRLGDVIRIRTQDLDFDQARLHVRNGKGFKDRITLLPRRLHGPIEGQLRRVAKLTRQDRQDGKTLATMPPSLRRKFGIESGRKWIWQYLFPSAATCRDRHTPPGFRMRHHIHDSTVQKAVTTAGRRARIPKRFGTHALRHSFATHMVQDGVDIHTVQKLLGHRDIRTTLIYVHLAEITADKITSPIDRLWDSGTLAGPESLGSPNPPEPKA